MEKTYTLDEVISALATCGIDAPCESIDRYSDNCPVWEEEYNRGREACSTNCDLQHFVEWAIREGQKQNE